MTGHLSPTVLLFKLSRLFWEVARPRTSFRNLSRAPLLSQARSLGTHSEESPVAKLDRSFQLLGVAKEGCTVEQIRGAYIDLVKQYHPDSKGPDASAETFAKVCGLDIKA